MLTYKFVKVFGVSNSTFSNGASGDGPRVFFAGAVSGEVEGFPADASAGSYVWEVDFGRVGDPG